MIWLRKTFKIVCFESDQIKDFQLLFLLNITYFCFYILMGLFTEILSCQRECIHSPNCLIIVSQISKYPGRMVVVFILWYCLFVLFTFRIITKICDFMKLHVTQSPYASSTTRVYSVLWCFSLLTVSCYWLNGCSKWRLASAWL